MLLVLNQVMNNWSVMRANPNWYFMGGQPVHCLLVAL